MAAVAGASAGAEAIRAQLAALERELARASDPSARIGSAQVEALRQSVATMSADAAAAAAAASSAEARSAGRSESKAGSDSKSDLHVRTEGGEPLAGHGAGDFDGGGGGGGGGGEQRDPVVVFIPPAVQLPGGAARRDLRTVDMSDALAALHATSVDDARPPAAALEASMATAWITTGMFPQAAYLTLRAAKRIGRVEVSVAGARSLSLHVCDGDSGTTMSLDSALRARLRRDAAAAAGVAAALADDDGDAGADDWSVRIPCPDPDAWRMVARATVSRAAAKEISTATFDISGVRTRHLCLSLDAGWDDFAAVHRIVVYKVARDESGGDHSPAAHGLTPGLARGVSQRRRSRSFNRIN
uniref:Uncharacterized protein n=1 Tax=Bicosoecida sp. CB-2014 TaxID=1486930 RepID=A0A7S1G848_9STRA|mmetsp:Transcript_1999/g.6409  ORF Transcript_1999/g.6409 Transcript_1999/m.6409 type:complete len:358 (+) Transcript_1999:173-1246(+)